jgi:hypothetical protein
MVTWANIRLGDKLDAVCVELELELLGQKCFVYRREYYGDYKVTERRSGYGFGDDGDTVQDAIDKAREKLETVGPEKFQAAIDKAVAQYGAANE